MRWLIPFVALCTSLPAADRPNILFFFADDQRFDTLSCAGHPIVQTPAIDQLAADAPLLFHQRPDDPDSGRVPECPGEPGQVSGDVLVTPRLG